MADIPWTWLGIRASGITTWGLLTAVVVWGLLLRSRLLGRLAAPVRLLELHRWLGAVALVFLGIHLGLLLVDPSVHFTVTQILVPGLAPWSTTAVALGTIALWLLVPVSVVTLLARGFVPPPRPERRSRPATAAPATDRKSVV